jgi:hypothetical protein
MQPVDLSSKEHDNRYLSIKTITRMVTAEFELLEIACNRNKNQITNEGFEESS